MDTRLEDIKGLTRQTPWLLSTNRKLRHVQGISLRNVSFDEQRRHSRLETVDDACLPSASNTSAKLRALHDLSEHSKSSTNIQTISSVKAEVNNSNAGQPGASSRSRPSVSSLRRRSTQNWSNTTPDLRQKALEDVVANRLSETFVSIHGIGTRYPIYITETSPKTMNPDFAFFDLQSRESLVTRLDEVVINVWFRKAKMKEYAHLVQVQVHLSSLGWLGKSLKDLDQLLPKNTVILHLIDGVYACSAESSTKLTQPFPSTPTIPSTPDVSNTSNFDSLMRLKNLDDCIQDAVVTHSEMVAKIQEILDTQKAKFSLLDEVSSQREFLDKINTAVRTTGREHATMEEAKLKIKAQNEQLDSAMQEDALLQSEESVRLDEAINRFIRHRASMKRHKDEFRGQVRRLAEDLSACFPIEPVKGQQLGFTINGMYLPDAEDLIPYAAHDRKVEQTQAAALGLVCDAMNLIALYLEHPMPYPVNLQNSTTTIYDYITSNKEKHSFPLYQTGVPKEDFEYAVYLLNTNLVGLMGAQNLRVVNPRTTLANLKYLLTVLACGPGEVPERKQGYSQLSRAWVTGGSSTEASSNGAVRTEAPNTKG